MKLRDIDFGNILGASGVQGFFGEGYRHHTLLKPFGLNFSGMTFVAKTATLSLRAGNMPLRPDHTPRELLPSCIKVRAARGVALNAVGLSNPGLAALIAEQRWQTRRMPFFLSVMSVAPSKEERLEELRGMVELLKAALPMFSAPIGLQVNLSCPNTGHDPHELIDESWEVLDIVRALQIPVMPKYSIATAPIPALLELQRHPTFDALCVSNTLPFGWKTIDWRQVWGSTTSPLAHLGGGGLSGAPLCPLVCEYILRLRDAGFEKPINGGGGILHRSDVNRYHHAGASSVFIGSVAILRPWRVRRIIRRAHSLDWS